MNSDAKPSLVVVAETDVLLFLRYYGIYPKEFYTDLEIFRKQSVFFDNVVVLFLTVGCSVFSRRSLMSIYSQMLDRANDETDTGIYDVIILSDTTLTGCKDYLKYDDHPLTVVRYSGSRAKSKPELLKDILEYEQAQQTVMFLKDADYGFSKEALDGVRVDRSTELELIKQIKVPDIV